MSSSKKKAEIIKKKIETNIEQGKVEVVDMPKKPEENIKYKIETKNEEERRVRQMSANNNFRVFTEYVDKSLITDLLNTTELNNEYFNILQSYKKLNKANKVQVLYNQKYNGMGRLYAKNNGARTLQNMPRELRNTLARGRYIDLDMVNALPTILYEECKKHNIKSPLLRKYNKYRDTKLQELMSEFNCDRNVAKELPNRLMNGGGVNTWIRDNELYSEEEDTEIPEFWILFKEELEKVYKGLYKIYYEYYKVVLDNQDEGWNDIARLVSIALQDKENDILQEAINFLTELKWKCDVPIHDGMLIQNKEGFDDNVIEELEKHIKKELGFSVKWKVKPMDDIIEIEKDTEDDEWLPEMEKCEVYDASYCMTIEGDSQRQTYLRRKKYVEIFLTQTYHPEILFHFKNHKNNAISMYRRQGLIERLEDTLSGIIGDGSGRQLSFTEVWLKDHMKNTRQTYNWLPMNPTNDLHLNNIEPDTYNTFCGYSNKIDTFFTNEEHILDLWKEVVFNLCEGDHECYHYYICFLAQLIQDPSNKKGVAVGFKSLQGEGKGAHLEALSYVIGEDHYFSSDKMEDFFGNHAEAFPKRLLVNIDEVNGSQKHTSAIKTKITEKNCVLNAKNLRPVKIRNFARCVFTMNGLTLVFDMESDERRFAMFEGNGKNLKYKKYKGGWERIIQHWRKAEHVSALFKYLNEYTIDIDIINERPMTDIYKTMLFKNKPYICGYMEQFLTGCKWREHEPYILGYEFQHEPNMEEDHYYEEVVKIRASELRRSINEYLKENGYEFQLTPKQILPELKKLRFPVEYTQKAGNNYYVFCPKNMYDYMVERKWIEVVLLEQERYEVELKDYDEKLFMV
jgi:hypothetical protein